MCHLHHYSKINGVCSVVTAKVEYPDLYRHASSSVCLYQKHWRNIKKQSTIGGLYLLTGLCPWPLLQRGVITSQLSPAHCFSRDCGSYLLLNHVHVTCGMSAVQNRNVGRYANLVYLWRFRFQQIMCHWHECIGI